MSRTAGAVFSALVAVLVFVPGAVAGDAVLIYRGNGGLDPDEASASFISALEGAGASRVDNTTVWPASLGDYRVVVLVTGDSAGSGYSTGQVDELSSFLETGALVVLADGDDYASTTNGILNALLADLGSSLSILDSSLNSFQCSTGTVEAPSHPLMAGVRDLSYVYSNDLDIGSGTELVSGNRGQRLVAVEGRVVLTADTGVFYDGYCELHVGNPVFAANIFAGACDWDADGAAAAACGGADCDDDDATVGAEPVLYVSLDADGDGYGDASSSIETCVDLPGYVEDATDCDDRDATVSPGATEYCDGVDNDCDGVIDEDSAADASSWYADADGDGYGLDASAVVSCSPLDGQVSQPGDCDDSASAVNPGATEYCDGVDNNCDALIDEDTAEDAPTWYADADADGHGDVASPTRACEEPAGYAAAADDCDDADAEVHPLAAEVADDGLDQDCDGEDGTATGGTGDCGCAEAPGDAGWWGIIGAVALLRCLNAGARATPTGHPPRGPVPGQRGSAHTTTSPWSTPGPSAAVTAATQPAPASRG